MNNFKYDLNLSTTLNEMLNEMTSNLSEAHKTSDSLSSFGSQVVFLRTTLFGPRSGKKNTKPSNLGFKVI